MKILGLKFGWSALAVTTVCLALNFTLTAQVKTTSSATVGPSSVVTKIDRGEVVTVSGNDLVVKMADGSVRHFTNVPDSARVTVDGKQLSVHDLKPGMKLQRTISTTTTPMTVTTIQTVKGKVWHIIPPASIILTMEDGKNQQFKIPEDQKFNVDGQEIDAFAVRKGMIVTATKITEVPSVQVTKSTTVTGQAPPAPAPAAPALQTTLPSVKAPILVAEGDETPVPAAEAETPAAAPAPATTPETESSSPIRWMYWLLGIVLLAGIIGWLVIRNRPPRS